MRLVMEFEYEMIWISPVMRCDLPPHLDELIRGRSGVFIERVEVVDVDDHRQFVF